MPRKEKNHWVAAQTPEGDLKAIWRMKARIFFFLFCFTEREVWKLRTYIGEGM